MMKAIDDGLLVSLCEKAGEKIMTVYNDTSLFEDITIKADKSPLTLADKLSNEIIVEGLQELYPEIPIISEEGKEVSYEVRKEYAQFWLVDPLDGTKEFINRNGDFTVNIALIKDGYPVAGYIYAPAHNIYYLASHGEARRIDPSGEKAIHVGNRTNQRTAVQSRSHSSDSEKEVLGRYQVTESMSRGSSFKFCMVAEGTADIYYRHGPTMEWDTAAGQAVLEASGGHMFVGDTPGKRFSYNKESLLNQSFLCLGFDA